MAITVGSLFSGAGMLDMGLEMFTDIDLRFFCEFDKDASKVLAHHFPDIPNLGDITKVDWSQVEPVEMLVGGFPCQDISSAGKRKGILDGERSALWFEYAKAIRTLRPTWVVVENVRALVTRGLDIVTGTLADAGYEFRWTTLRASEVGVPHRRDRCFILATDSTSLGDRAEKYRRETGGTDTTGSPSGSGRSDWRFAWHAERSSSNTLSSADGSWDTTGESGERPSSDPANDGLSRGWSLWSGRKGSQDDSGRPIADPQSDQGRLLDGDDVRAGSGTERLREAAGDGGSSDKSPSYPDSGGFVLDGQRDGRPERPGFETPCGDDSDRRREVAQGAVGVGSSFDSDCTRPQGRGGPLEREDGREVNPPQSDLQPGVRGCPAASDPSLGRNLPVNWGKYEPAVRRWESLFRPVPHPHDERGRLSPRLVEWMMSLPDGWVTSPDIGLKRTAQLKILGNGVVPPQACLAMELLTNDALWLDPSKNDDGQRDNGQDDQHGKEHSLVLPI